MDEKKLQYLLDRQSIRDTLLRHGAAFDEADLEALDGIWTEDCRRDDGPGRGEPFQGRAELKRRLSAAVAKFEWTHHQLGDSLIEIDGDAATSTTFVACWHKTVEGEICWGTARYYDQLVRLDDAWLIASRRMVMTGAEGALVEHGGAFLQRKVHAFAEQS